MGLHAPPSCLVRESFTNYRTGSVVENPAANAGDPVSIPGLERSPGGRNENPLQDSVFSIQYSCLENPMDRGARQVIVYGFTKELDKT